VDAKGRQRREGEEASERGKVAGEGAWARVWQRLVSVILDAAGGESRQVKKTIGSGHKHSPIRDFYRYILPPTSLAPS
jgi:hypothetical protein